MVEMLQGLSKHINKVGYFTIDTGPEINGEKRKKKSLKSFRVKD